MKPLSLRSTERATETFRIVGSPTEILMGYIKIMKQEW
jgi:hypothetical protein